MSMANLDWDDTKYFLAVLREGSLAGAARQLGCSHSTVRRRLASLEEQLEVSLFVAASDGLAPTDAGFEALPLAEAIERAALDFGRQLSGRSTELRGRIRCTIIDVLAEWIAPALIEMSRRHPAIGVELISDNRHLDLTRREADVAIRASNRPAESLVGRRIGRFEYAPFASPSLVERLGDDFRALPWVLFSEQAGATLTERWYRSWSDCPPRYRVTDPAPLLALVRAGVAAALLPAGFEGEVPLVQLAPSIEGLGMDLWCLTHPDLRHSARIRAFMECVAEHVSPTPSRCDARA